MRNDRATAVSPAIENGASAGDGENASRIEARHLSIGYANEVVVPDISAAPLMLSIITVLTARAADNCARNV